GIRISDTALASIQPPSTHLLVVAGSQVVASTLKDPAQNDAVLRQLADRVAGERFLPATGTLDAGGSAAGLRYILLSSTERQLGALEQIRVALLGLSAAGILISAAVVWFFVRRITHPLIELRDSAEAVGRGDFSRRIERFSNDECGELAQAFNRMTASLQSSRAELERA